MTIEIELKYNINVDNKKFDLTENIEFSVIQQNDLIVTKGLSTFSNGEKVLCFIMIIEPFKKIIKKLEAYFFTASDKLLQSIDVYSSWKIFFNHIKFLNKELNSKFDDELNSTYHLDLKKVKYVTEHMIDNESFTEICKIIEENPDEKVRKILLNETFSDLFMRDNKLFFDDLTIETEYYNPIEKKKKENELETSKQKSNENKSISKSTNIDIIPIVDPVNGITADSLKINDEIVVKTKAQNIEITAPVSRVIPATMKDRILITINISDDTTGSMIIPKNLKVKTKSENNNTVYDNYLFYIYLLGGLILLLAVISIIYLIF